ncbi:pentatricopeptide repeat-containing protein At1g31920-like [Aegilops tauschii subsp. strangulata]|uniref:pentatricopeptide repeat-containing protein At1g31920-like n=1 Tax=Aegilops tauschii subsp. strangulata TaxID=200361 RepID=UPI000989E89C|nr:pentatricopeptide repeat-containing protein At1g31920-like [Aegilops tauschii subsp. strangulata]
MLHNDVEPDGYTFPFVVKACAQLAALRQRRQLQGHAVKLGFLEHDEHAQNSLISFYGKCGEPELARRAFEQMEARERTGGVLERAARGVHEACAYLGTYDVGRSVHCLLLRNTVTLNTFMETSLVDMYPRCGCIEKATVVFDGMEGKKNEWTYIAMVSGLALHGDGRTALQVFDAMIREGHQPDDALGVHDTATTSFHAPIWSGAQITDP